jgi:fermentation-respiration switch protein FrsA (DUF1100 family)
MDQESKRPTPPPGFVPFQWKTRLLRRGEPGEHSAEICPNCGAPRRAGDRWGFRWLGGGWTDPAAQAAYDEGMAKGVRLLGAGDRQIVYENVPILMHWSRYGAGECVACGCPIWHDFVGHNSGPQDRWAYYYRPTRGQLALF